MARRKSKFVGAYVPREVKRRLLVLAREQDRPLTYIIEKILEQGLKHHEAKEAA